MAKFIEKTGESIEEAIVILDASNHMEGVGAEYEYLAKKIRCPGQRLEIDSSESYALRWQAI